MLKIKTLNEVASIIPNNAVIAVNASSGLCCPDHVLKAIGERFDKESMPKNITTIHPLAAGDMFGMKGIDHLVKAGLLKKIIGGSYPSGPSSAEPPLIWKALGNNEIAAYNVPCGVIFDILKATASQQPGVLTKIGLGTFADPDIEGCAMNNLAQEVPIVKKIEFEGEQWLYFPIIKPDIAIIRASTADENGNLTFEHEGAYFGAIEIALAAHNCGGKVIAQVKHIAASGSIRPHDVQVPGIIVDYVVEVPDQLQTTATQYDPAISGEVLRPLSSFEIPDFGIPKVIARRVAMELKPNWVVNIGFGISANVPRILLDEGCHGAVTWAIEQGAVGGIPLGNFKFGCSSNAEAFVSSPNLFSLFQSGGFNAALLSFLQIDSTGSVNVSKLPTRPHVTAGIGGFIDITSRAKKIVFSGYFNAGAKMKVENGKLMILQEGKVAKIVEAVEQVSFSGQLAIQKGQDVTYITERCVIKLTAKGLLLTEVAPGIDIDRDILTKTTIPLSVSPEIKPMESALFFQEKMGLHQHFQE